MDEKNSANERQRKKLDRLKGEGKASDAGPSGSIILPSPQRDANNNDDFGQDLAGGLSEGSDLGFLLNDDQDISLLFTDEESAPTQLDPDDQDFLFPHKEPTITPARRDTTSARSRRATKQVSAAPEDAGAKENLSSSADAFKPFLRQLPERRGKRVNTAYTFLCPNCGQRLVNDDCVVDLRFAILRCGSWDPEEVLGINKGSGEQSRKTGWFPAGVTCTLPVVDLRDGAQLVITAGIMVTQLLEDAGYRLESEETVLFRDALLSAASRLGAELKRKLHWEAVDEILFQNLLKAAAQDPDMPVLDARITFNNYETDRKGMPPVQGIIRVNMANGLYIDLLRCCPRCSTTLASFLGSREEVFIGLKGKTYAGKTTFLCALAQVIEQNQGVAQGGALSRFGKLSLEPDLHDGAGGWADGFLMKYEKFCANGRPGKNAKGEHVHFTLRAVGSRFIDERGKTESVEKILTFADVPGELYVNGADTRFLATESADLSILCVTPGQLDTDIRSKELEQLKDQVDEQEGSEQAEADMRLDDYLRVLVRESATCAVLLCKADLFRDKSPHLYPDSKTDDDQIRRLSALNYRGIVTQELKAYSARIQGYITNIGVGARLVNWINQNTPDTEGSRAYFAVSCGNQGPGGADRIGLIEPLLWILTQAGLLPEVNKIVTMSRRRGSTITYAPLIRKEDRHD